MTLDNKMQTNFQRILVFILVVSFSQYLFDTVSYTFSVENELGETLKQKKASEVEVSECVVSSHILSQIHHNIISFQTQYISVRFGNYNISGSCERSPPSNI